jgi:hypothetical protein
VGDFVISFDYFRYWYFPWAGDSADFHGCCGHCRSMHELFHSASISWLSWGKIMSIALSAFVIVEIEKTFTRHRPKASISSK